MVFEASVAIETPADCGLRSEIQQGDGEHTGFAAFSEEDEEIYPHSRPHHVRDADDREVDDRIDLNGAFHGCRFVLAE